MWKVPLDKKFVLVMAIETILITYYTEKLCLNSYLISSSNQILLKIRAAWIRP